MWQAVAELPAKERILVYLFYCEGYSLEEAARMCGCSYAAARQRLSRPENTCGRNWRCTMGDLRHSFDPVFFTQEEKEHLTARLRQAAEQEDNMKDSTKRAIRHTSHRLIIGGWPWRPPSPPGPWLPPWGAA